MSKRETQFRHNVYDILGGYANGMSDCPDEFPAMELADCIMYVKAQVYDIRATGNGMTAYEKGICKDLRFLGNAKMLPIIEEIAMECEVLV